MAHKPLAGNVEPAAIANEIRIPWFGARRIARELASEVARLRKELARAQEQLQRLGALSVIELEAQRDQLARDNVAKADQFARARQEAQAELHRLAVRMEAVRASIVQTEDLAILQEAGVYFYRHPLSDAVAYKKALDRIDERVKAMNRKDGGAVLAASGWTVNGSEAQGRTMLRDYCKLMLRAFNAEADNLVRGLRPYKLPASLERIRKVAETIERLGKTMQLRIAPEYLSLRIEELELTADFLERQAEEKESERRERERLKEERRVQKEIDAERARLDKERQHYLNALQALTAKGDTQGIERVQAQLADVQHAIEDVDYRAANIRAGYVYVISNIGSFGDQTVKVGMTRRLDPLDRIRELSDASVPFNFDVHAVFFSTDAVGIEAEMHRRLAHCRINTVNLRREFFSATALEAKSHLAQLAGELLEFQDQPEALEYRQCVAARGSGKGVP